MIDVPGIDIVIVPGQLVGAPPQRFGVNRECSLGLGKALQHVVTDAATQRLIHVCSMPRCREKC